MAIISDDEDLGRRVKKNPVIKPETIEYDNTFENSIRPKDFDSYIGQSSLKETLKITLEAAKRREQPLDHLLFYGPPGLGKINDCWCYCSPDGSRNKDYISARA